MTPCELRAPGIEEALARISVADLPRDARVIAIVAWAGFRPFLVKDEEGWAVTADDLSLGRFEDAINFESAVGRRVKIFGARVVEAAVVVDPTKVWPKGEIPYEVDSELQEKVKTKIDSAITTWNRRAGNPVQLRSKQTEDRDFVLFVEGSSNKSSVGKVGGKQLIELMPGLGTWKIVHEIGHAAGLFHEHNRHDRNTYISLIWSRIPAGERSKYDRYLESTSLGRYDFDSIMHYRPNTSYKLGTPIFDVTSDGKTHYGGSPPFGVTNLSDGDVGALQAIYSQAT